MTVSTPAYADRFDTCVKSFWPAAKRAGVSWDTFQRATAGITFDNEVIEAAKFQPEYKKPMGEYVDRAISPKRLAMGQQKLVEYGPLLDQVEARYGVDKHIVLAIWGVESNYGTNKGDMHVIQSLMTLACSGTKAKFARGQIVSALKILQHGDTDPAHFSGSWAGAMGHTQFIPTTYSAYAVDFDGDGRRDIWDTVPDALGSTAAYLRKSNWIPGQTWGYEVKLPASYTAKSYKRGSLRTLAQWQAAGITRVNGKPFPRPGDKAQLLSPDGRNGPSFLVLNNFRSILRYNQADSYALAVGHLADRLAGYGAFVQAWPTSELRLSMEQRTEMQQYLIALGYLQGDADGIIGSGTMDGVRAYQRAKGLPVDGYPTRRSEEAAGRCPGDRAGGGPGRSRGHGAAINGFYPRAASVAASGTAGSGCRAPSGAAASTPATGRGAASAGASRSDAAGLRPAGLSATAPSAPNLAMGFLAHGRSVVAPAKRGRCGATAGKLML